MRKILSSKIFYSTLAVGFLLILAVDLYSSSEVSHSFSSISFLEDKKNTLEVDQVISKLNKDKSSFKKTKNKHNFGYSNSSFWLKANLNSKIKQKDTLFILINPPLLDTLEFYTLSENNQVLKKTLTGDLHPFKQREFSYRRFLFKVNPKKSTSFLVKLKSKSYIPVNFTILDQENFINNEIKESLLYGLFIGVSLILVILHLSIFFSRNEKGSLFYSIYIICFTLITFSTSGFAFQVLYPNFPEFNQVAHIWFTSITSLSIFLFLNNFFNVDRTERLNKVRQGFVIIWILPLGLTFFQKYAIMRIMSHFLIFANFILLCLIIARYWKEKSMESKISSIAFGFLIIGGTSQILYIHGFTPQNFFFYNSYIFGGLLQMIVFSLGLVLKMKEFQEESLKNKSRLIEINQKINQVLKNEVSKKTEALEKKNQRLKEYDFIVAHDLKNPLGAILSYTEIFDLKDGEDPEKTKRIMNNIRSVAFRAIDLIDGLLKVVTSGTLELRKHSIELIIKWASSQLTKKINETNTIIQQDLSVLSFFCDDVSMEQVFANIIENSIKYKSPDKAPEIIIKSWEENDKVYISFKDNGIGIPEVIKSNVFSKDFRGEESEKSNIDGYGLGLYHVKNLVIENKGSIEITDTKENEGTTITLCFFKDP